MKVSNNFIIQEFIPPGIWDKFGESSIWFIDQRVITFAQFLRDRYGKAITINDWHSGGNRNQSGLRYWSTGVGASMSQHKFGRAGDLKWLQDPMVMDEIREDIKRNQQLFIRAGLTTVELGTETWIHGDCRWTNKNGIYFIPYYK